MNLVPAQYREVSVTEVPVPLDEGALRAYLAGRDVYRRTRYVIARNGSACMLAKVGKQSEQPLFSPVTWVTVLARADETALVEALAAAVGPDCVVFEAPREDQQAWFVRRFGPDVNLANVPPDGALGLETFRLSLRADTYRAPAPGPLLSTAPVRGT